MENLDFFLQFPLFVSFPRTGTHWLNCVMELYFDRPRLRQSQLTFLPNRTDWMWFSDHDGNCLIEHKDVLYLYRNPVDTIYSNCSVENNFTKEFITTYCELYRNHLIKWLLSDLKARTIISYEEMQSNPLNVLRIISEHFKVPYNATKAKDALSVVTKEAMIKISNTRYITDGLLTDDYKIKRIEFTKNFKSYIEDIILTPELNDFLITQRTDRPPKTKN